MNLQGVKWQWLFILHGSLAIQWTVIHYLSLSCDYFPMYYAWSTVNIVLTLKYSIINKKGNNIYIYIYKHTLIKPTKLSFALLNRSTFNWLLSKMSSWRQMVRNVSNWGWPVVMIFSFEEMYIYIYTWKILVSHLKLQLYPQLAYVASCG